MNHPKQSQLGSSSSGNSFLTQITISESVLSLTSRAFLVGWNIENFRCCIVGAFELPHGDFGRLQNALASTVQTLSSIYATCSPNGTATPIVLGEWIPPGTISESDSIPSCEFQGQSIWITISCDPSELKYGIKLPKLLSIYSLGCLYSTSCYMVVYKPVDTDRLRAVSLVGGGTGGTQEVNHNTSSRTSSSNSNGSANHLNDRNSRENLRGYHDSLQRDREGSFSSVRGGYAHSDYSQSPQGSPNPYNDHQNNNNTSRYSNSRYGGTTNSPGGGFGHRHGWSASGPGLGTTTSMYNEESSNRNNHSTFGGHNIHAARRNTTSGNGGMDGTVPIALSTTSSVSTDFEYIVAQINAGHDLLLTTAGILSHYDCHNHDSNNNSNSSNSSKDPFKNYPHSTEHHPHLPNSLGLGLCYTQGCVLFQYLFGWLFKWIRTCLVGFGGRYHWYSGFVRQTIPIPIESWISTSWLAWTWYTLITRIRRILEFKFAYVPLGYGWLGPWVLLFSPLVGAGVVAPSPFSLGRSTFSSGSGQSSSRIGGDGLNSTTKTGAMNKHAEERTTHPPSPSRIATGSRGQRTGASSLADVSCTLSCLTQRFEAMEDALIKCTGFSKAWMLPAVDRQRLWVHVMATVCMVCIDMLLGITLGQLLYRHAHKIAHAATQLCVWLQTEMLKRAIESFKHAPYGIKFNPLITHKVGYVLKFVVREFAQGVAITAPVHVLLIRLIACMGSLGLTLQLSAVIDALSLLTVHVALIHKISAGLHQFQINLIVSLWHLFKGQKVNILRKRLDTCEYDRLQLLFGTVLFTIVFFLFPSFAAYFYLFAAAQLAIVSLQLVLWSVVVGVKEFPYYSLAMCIYDPLSLTEGLRFQLLTPSPLVHEHDHTNTVAATRTASTSTNLISSTSAQPGGKVPLSGAMTSSSSSSSSSSTSESLNEPQNTSAQGLGKGLGQGLGQGSLHHRKAPGGVTEEEGGSGGHTKPQLQILLETGTSTGSASGPGLGLGSSTGLSSRSVGTSLHPHTASHTGLAPGSELGSGPGPELGAGSQEGLTTVQKVMRQFFYRPSSAAATTTTTTIITSINTTDTAIPSPTSTTLSIVSNRNDGSGGHRDGLNTMASSSISDGKDRNGTHSSQQLHHHVTTTTATSTALSTATSTATSTTTTGTPTGEESNTKDGDGVLLLPSGRASRANKALTGLAPNTGHPSSFPAPPLSPPQLRPMSTTLRHGGNTYPPTHTALNSTPPYFFPQVGGTGEQPPIASNHNHHNLYHNNLHNNAHNYSPQTIYLELSARPLTLWKLFAAYGDYASYFTAPGGVINYLVHGFLYGKPSLDNHQMQQAMILSAWTMQSAYTNGTNSKGKKGSNGVPGQGQGMEFTTRRDQRHLAGSGPSIFNRSNITNNDSTNHMCIIPFHDLLRTVALSCQPHKTFYVPKTVHRSAGFVVGSGSVRPSELAQGPGLGQGDNDASSVSTHSHSSRRSGDIVGEGDGDESTRYSNGDRGTGMRLLRRHSVACPPSSPHHPTRPSLLLHEHDLDNQHEWIHPSHPHQNDSNPLFSPKLSALRHSYDERHHVYEEDRWNGDPSTTIHASSSIYHSKHSHSPLSSQLNNGGSPYSPMSSPLRSPYPLSPLGQSSKSPFPTTTTSAFTSTFTGSFTSGSGSGGGGVGSNANTLAKSTVMQHQHTQANIHPSPSYISIDNHHPNSNYSYSPHSYSPQQHSPNRQQQRQGLAVPALGSGLAKIEATDVQVVILQESLVKRRLNKWLLFAVLSLYSISLVSTLTGLGLIVYAILPAYARKAPILFRKNKRFSAWLNMFDGSVGAAWRGDTLSEHSSGGGSSGDGSGVSLSSNAYFAIEGNAVHGEGERTVVPDTSIVSMAMVTKGSSGEVRGNVGIVSNGSSSSSSSSTSSFLRLRTRV